MQLFHMIHRTDLLRCLRMEEQTVTLIRNKRKKIMDNAIEFSNVLYYVKNTVLKELVNYPIDTYSKDIIWDNKRCFRIIIEWERCIGELIVNDEEYTPYRYVYFSILSSITDEVTTVFSWYDSDNDTLEIIRDKIQYGLSVAFNY